MSKRVLAKSIGQWIYNPVIPAELYLIPHVKRIKGIIL